MNHPWVDAILRMPLFQGFTEHGARHLLDVGQVKEHPPGAQLCKEGEPAGAVLLLLSGSLRAYIERAGTELPISDFGPGAILGEVAMLCDIPWMVSVRALEGSTVLSWPDHAFRKLLFEDVFLSHRIFGNALRALVEMEKERVQAAEARRPTQAV